MELTRSYLESLTTRELLRMGDREGIDMPPDLERVFIIQELLENGAPEKVREPAEAEDRLYPVLLPRQYNITSLEILLRDPLWVFAFWEIKNQDRERFESLPGFEGYYLRVISLEPGLPDTAFTVYVGAGDNSWYLGFPPLGGAYRVELCFRQKNNKTRDVRFKTITGSRVFSMPRPPNPPGNEENLKNPLTRLSGADNYSLLSNSGLRYIL